MLNVKNTMLDTVLSVIAPHLCSGCGQVGSSFCDNCKYDITIEPFSGCVLCEKPANLGVCGDHNVAFNQAWVVGTRSGPLQRLIGGFKFRNMKEAGGELARLLDKRLPGFADDVVLVPIPTTTAHIRERGYDHMLIISEHLGKIRHSPVQSLLVRRSSSVQHRANRTERFSQITSAFSADGYVDPNKTYLILDDVITTGATIIQAALLLQQAGARTIWVAATSRQPLD